MACLFFLVFCDRVALFDRDGLNVEDDDFESPGVGAAGGFLWWLLRFGFKLLQMRGHGLLAARDRV